MPEIFGTRIDTIVFFGCFFILAAHAIPAIAYVGVSMIEDLYRDMADDFKKKQ